MIKIKNLLIVFFIIITIYSEKMCQAMPINISYSTINFPYHLAFINATRPTITGSLLDDNQNPAGNETVEIFVNGARIGTTTSNNDGIYEFHIEKDLPDGVYVVTVFCVESQSLLGPNSFTVDTTLPLITLVSPSENEIIPNTTFTASGITEANAMVETFLDDDTYGSVCYADESGNWSIEYSADSGLHTLKAQATDLAGNQGPLSDPRSFIITFIKRET